jgi:hypothetical protein
MAPGDETGYIFFLGRKDFWWQFTALPGGGPCLGSTYRSKE